MAGHYRVASPSAQVGQPEVNLGIIPEPEERSACRASSVSPGQWRCAPRADRYRPATLPLLG